LTGLPKSISFKPANYNIIHIIIRGTIMETQEKSTKSITIEYAIVSLEEVVGLLRELAEKDAADLLAEENELFKAVLVDTLDDIIARSARNNGDQVREVLKKLATVIKENDRTCLTDKHLLSIRIFF